jgi:hypothetical protein
MTAATFGGADRMADPNFNAGKLAMVGDQFGNVIDQFTRKGSNDSLSLAEQFKDFFSRGNVQTANGMKLGGA